MIELITNKPIAIDSLDHINPYGCIRDNNSFNSYIMEVKNYFNKQIHLCGVCIASELGICHGYLFAGLRP